MTELKAAAMSAKNGLMTRHIEEFNHYEVRLISAHLIDEEASPPLKWNLIVVAPLTESYTVPYFMADTSSTSCEIHVTSR